MGKGYFFKLMFLLLMTAILSWYSRQGRNNPFSSQNMIRVISNDGEVQLEYVSGARGKKNLTIVAAGEKLICGNKSPKAGAWDLVSFSVSIDSSCLKVFPESWNIIDTTSDSIEIPAGWPRPVINKQVRSGNTSAEFITPFTDNRTALLISFKSISCLVADGSSFKCSPGESTQYKEKIELIVALNASPDLTLALRDCFRPRYILTPDKCSEQISNFKNVLCSSDTRSEFAFGITRRNTLRLQ